MSRVIITLFGFVGLVWGYIIQQFSQTVYILGAGFVLAALVINFSIFILLVVLTNLFGLLVNDSSLATLSQETIELAESER